MIQKLKAVGWKTRIEKMKCRNSPAQRSCITAQSVYMCHISSWAASLTSPAFTTNCLEMHSRPWHGISFFSRAVARSTKPRTLRRKRRQVAVSDDAQHLHRHKNCFVAVSSWVHPQGRRRPVTFQSCSIYTFLPNTAFNKQTSQNMWVCKRSSPQATQLFKSRSPLTTHCLFLNKHPCFPGSFDDQPCILTLQWTPSRKFCFSIFDLYWIFQLILKHCFLEGGFHTGGEKMGTSAATKATPGEGGTSWSWVWRPNSILCALTSGCTSQINLIRALKI